MNWLVLIFSLSFAESTITGKGKFLAQQGDSLALIKRQLFVSAFRDCLDQQIKKRGLDSDAFWKAYDAKYEDRLTKHAESIKKSIGKGRPEEEWGTAEKSEYKDRLRQKRLSLKESFESPFRSMSSYKMKKKISRSSFAGMRYLAVSCTPNDSYLSKLYRKYMSHGQFKAYRKAYLSFTSSFDDGLFWTGIGVDDRENFINSLGSQWANWLKGQLQARVEDVEFVSVSQTNDFLEKMARLQSSKDIQSTNAEDSLWITNRVKISKVPDESGDLKLSLEAEIAVKEVAGGAFFAKTTGPVKISLPLASTDLSEELKQSMRQTLANSLYGLPLDSWRSMSQVILKRPKFTVAKVSVTGVKAFRDLYQIGAKLEQAGVALRLQATPSSIAIDKGGLKVEYVGAEDDFLALLGKLGQRSDALFKFQESEGQISLAMIPRRESNDVSNQDKNP